MTYYSTESVPQTLAKVLKLQFWPKIIVDLEKVSFLEPDWFDRFKCSVGNISFTSVSKCKTLQVAIFKSAFRGKLTNRGVSIGPGGFLKRSKMEQRNATEQQVLRNGAK